MNINKILEKVDETRHRKAYDYFKQNRIKNAIIHNNQIIADVIGNDIYRVKILLDKGEVKCTCPDYVEHCKHIISVLIAYQTNKKMFFNFDKLLEDLKRKDKEELINIIKQMHINRIDLMNLLNLKSSKIKKIKDFSKDIYGVKDFFSGSVRYNEVPDLIKKLDSLYTLAINHKEKKDFTTSFAILWSLVRTISHKIGECDDSNGQIGDFFYECIADLSGIINNVIKEQKLREKFFDEILKIWNKNDFGIEDGLLGLIEESTKKEDVNFLIDKINNVIAINKSKYFIEYRKEELEELKKHLDGLKKD